MLKVLICIGIALISTVHLPAQRVAKTCNAPRESPTTQPQNTDPIRLNISTDNLHLKTPNSGPSVFNTGERILVSLRATNSSQEEAYVPVWDYFKPFLPSLRIDSAKVPYIAAMLNEANANLEQQPFRSSSYRFTLLPGMTTSLGIVDLTEWYGFLQPGIYHLRVAYREKGTLEQLESNEI